eukprot:5672049-Pyramimonas_sp.AAC.1
MNSSQHENEKPHDQHWTSDNKMPHDQHLEPFGCPTGSPRTASCPDLHIIVSFFNLLRCRRDPADPAAAGSGAPCAGPSPRRVAAMTEVATAAAAAAT